MLAGVVLRLLQLIRRHDRTWKSSYCDFLVEKMLIVQLSPCSTVSDWPALE